jgi:hypothetical protein
MIDIRRMSREEIDQINERAKLWKLRQQHPENHPKGEEVNQSEPDDEPREPAQLELPIT